MAKKSVGKAMPPGMSGDTPTIKSTNDLIKEVKEMGNEKSLVETIAEQEDKDIDDTPTNDEGNSDNNEDGASDDNKDNVDDAPANDNEETKNNNYVSNAKMSPAFAKELAKKEKAKKHKTMIYLDEDTMNKFKTLSMQSKLINPDDWLSVTKLFEIACKSYIKGQEVDEYLVAKYDETNSRKGQRPNQNKTNK